MFTILTKPGCTHCISAKQALDFKKLPYEEIVHITVDDMLAFQARGFQSFPQVFAEGVHIGGNNALQDYLLDKY